MRLFIISNRLPVKVTRSSDGKFVFSRSEGGLATGLKSLDVDCEKHWIGWPGVCVEQKTEKDDICCQLVKIIIIRYSYPTNSIKITTKDIATVPYGPSVITFLLIRYIKELLGII
jgi:trehalose-6-phosphate synthase